MYADPEPAEAVGAAAAELEAGAPLLAPVAAAGLADSAASPGRCIAGSAVRYSRSRDRKQVDPLKPETVANIPQEAETSALTANKLFVYVVT